MVIDYCSGGDLSEHLVSKGTFTQEETKIIAAQIILALEYIHNLNVIYRDMKPENILVDDEGNIKIADFGLAKEGVKNDEVSTSFCGSPAYLSPEMLDNRGAGVLNY